MSWLYLEEIRKIHFHHPAGSPPNSISFMMAQWISLEKQMVIDWTDPLLSLGISVVLSLCVINSATMNTLIHRSLCLCRSIRQFWNVVAEQIGFHLVSWFSVWETWVGNRRKVSEKTEWVVVGRLGLIIQGTTPVYVRGVAQVSGKLLAGSGSSCSCSLGGTNFWLPSFPEVSFGDYATFSSCPRHW